MDVPLFKCTNISKRFGATVALENINLELFKGEVHAILGENGAGKSTLMKILSGAVTPDSGEMAVENQLYLPGSPEQSRKHGVIMIYQELNLCLPLTVEQNINLGIEPDNHGIIDLQTACNRAKHVLSRLGHSTLDLNKKTYELNMSEMQIVEIARALVSNPKIIIFDEPTSSLDTTDVQRLFDIISILKSEGLGIFYISHFLEEIKQVADRFTVLRDGKIAAMAGDVKTSSVNDMIELMVGRKITEFFPKSQHVHGETVLELDNVSGLGNVPESVALQLHAGEVLGIAGLLGAGKTELVRSIFGLRQVVSGNVKILGVAGLLSEDRKNEGLALTMSVEDNVFLSNPKKSSGLFGWLNMKLRRGQVQGLVNQLDVKLADVADPVMNLSGGNQQKVAIARLLYQEADVFLLDEPTKGIDVNSKALIYDLINKLALQGKSVVFVSAYFQELLGVCDNICVMYRGKLSKPIPVNELTEHKLLTYATTGITL
jgi:ribose transport system ATP-binding protein